MSLQNITTSAAPATLAIDDEIQDLDLGSSAKVIALPAKTPPEQKSATVADSKPLDGEIITPTKGDEKVVATTAPNDAQFASVADRIRRRTQRGVLMLVENGRDLMIVKEKMGHGRFGDWLKPEFGWSERTAQNYMNAAKAFDELATRGCAPESVALLPPTTLYDFDRQSEDYKEKCVKNIMSSAIAKAAKRSKKVKPATSNKASASASIDRDQGAAEELAKLIAGALLASFKMQVGSHAGFASPAFGEFLQKEFARSFGAASSGKADRRKRMEEVADFLPSR